jgi:hypothetical protein
MSRLQDILDGQTPSYITPLFWQHGESESVLREEICQMSQNGINSFILESRPHPHFLEERWWHDLDVILDEARQRGMQVWIFDDKTYPSGFGAGKIGECHPEFMKVYLAEKHIDAIGPMKGSSFIIKAWLEEGDSLAGVVAARRAGPVDEIDGDSLLDLTAQVRDGMLYWDVPEGAWRLFMFIRTRRGGEEWTKDYVNPLEPEPVRSLIDTVYETHYHRYAQDFGKTLAGFFSDEPRFGNASTYDAALGKYPMVLPYSDRLLGDLQRAWGGDFVRFLPCLWYEAGDVTHAARYTYMDVVSQKYGQNFTTQIGDWCRAHHVRLIGHLVEDNGAHARLGYGAGHFFRAIEGQDTSGLDAVYQVWPEFSSGKFSTPFGNLDADFFYWGIAKLATSAGHIDPRKNGTTVCELFGAYGWQEGLKLMKWLTDHMLARGVNFLIPHAFSPKYNDPDCPPHFYSRGTNPQWRYFSAWSGYANRLCHLLSGGRHVAPVAVVYHAEAEWAGEYEPFEKAVKTLAQQQIDCDVLPIDTLLSPAAQVGEGRFTVNVEDYRAVVVPYAERLPGAFLERLLAMAEKHIPIIFMRGYPQGASRPFEKEQQVLAGLAAHPGISVCSHPELVSTLRGLGIDDLQTSAACETLRIYHYVNDGQDLYFCANQSKFKAVHTRLEIKQDGAPLALDAMAGKLYRLLAEAGGPGAVSVQLDLEPYQSLLVLFDHSTGVSPQSLPEWRVARGRLIQEIAGERSEWQISTATVESYPHFKPEPAIIGLGNFSTPEKLPQFSGTVRYETSFVLEKNADSGPLWLDLGDVYETAEAWLNDKPAGVRICPPYVVEVTGLLQAGKNQLRIEVTNTLAKARGNNGLDRAMAQEPSGLIGPVRLLE